jgi:PPP family 3-phenylpropionic acid transporter
MKNNPGNSFISFFVFSNIALAIVAPYLVIHIRDLGYSPSWVGILLGLFEVAGVIGPFIFGYLADKTGNYRSSLLISCVLPALVAFPLVFWVHPAVTILLLLFMAFGFRSLVSLIDAITTVQIGLSGNYGKLRVWGSVSFIFVTLFFQWSPFLKPDNALNISIWIFITSIICVIPVLLIPRHLLKTSEALETKEETVNVKVPITPFYVFCGFAIIFLSRFALTAVYPFLSTFLVEEIKWDAVGLIFAVAAMAEIPFLFVSKKLISRFGSMPLLAMSAVGVCLRLLILAVLPFKFWIIVSALLHSICFGIYHPAAIHFISIVFPVEKRGRGMSVYMIMGTGLPAFAGILAGGAIIEKSGYKALFIIYAFISALAVLIYGIYRVYKTNS